ncbi:MAG: iron-containing alcohol dehydrogenase [Nitrospinota bacterium]
MQDFVHFNPVKIIFGKDKVAQVGEVVKEHGAKCLFLYGKESIKKSGLHGRVVESLKAQNVEVIEHGGVKPNPVLSHTRDGVKKAKSGSINVVLAVGGGSTMDEAKAIAAGALYDGDVWDFFSKGVKPDKALPVITVPTLAATGSEMNGNLVVTNEETNEKFANYIPACFPKVSILDPVLTATVPANHTAYGIADIFSHLIEAYFNGEEADAPVQDRLAEGLILALMETSRRLMKNPIDYTARAQMLWLSSVALGGIPPAGRGKARFENHFIAHGLSALFDSAHGAGLSVVMPAWMAYFKKRDPGKFLQFAKRIWNVDDADEGIGTMKKWLSSIGAPVTLGQLGIGEKDIPAIVENVLPMAQMAKYDDLTEENITAILTNCL